LTGSDKPSGEGESSNAELKARLEALSGRLSSGGAPAGPDGDKPADGAMGQAMGQGMRAMGEFVGAIVVSAVIGWQLDEWVGSGPAFLLGFLVLGTAAGFWNVYRMAAKPTGIDRRPRR
jgi:ATP synthase protein I